jgi:tryptophan synthase alpha chain
MRTVVEGTSGFLYAASLMGVTGARAQVSAAAPDLVQRARTVTNLPIAVGLGVSTGEQARGVAQYADGVIVGSAFVRRILQSDNHVEACAAVRALAQELSEGVRG